MTFEVRRLSGDEFLDESALGQQPERDTWKFSTAVSGRAEFPRHLHQTASKVVRHVDGASIQKEVEAVGVHIRGQLGAATEHVPCQVPKSGVREACPLVTNPYFNAVDGGKGPVVH